ncbi:DUF6483 family protein [Novisyntrophococcus fermenticellae]|uniref:DUF6483 family protein n=1 Tax=Novisyntrophococcus fermenticellae TaxID=2068655 RepID=UPI001E5CBE71|nr:DUF6483 family protein [Novisyntrophococcus fermenticellae]
MDYEQDYVMRLIKQMMQALAKIIFKKTNEEEISETILTTGSEGEKEIDLFHMADNGQINEAENLLYEHLDTSDMSQLRNAFAFYEHINEYQNDFLEEHNYSREEVLEGIKNISEEFGVLGLVDALL